MSGPGAAPLTRLGFGAASIGNLYRAISDDVARGAIDMAWDAGVRYFDTAPHYGLGLSERRLGLALANRPRDDFVISTKVGRLLQPSHEGGSDLAIGGYAVPADSSRVWDFSADGVKRSLESSLQRLGMDRVDIVYIHDPDNHVEAAEREAYPALADLRAQGVIRQIGIGMNQWEVPARFVRATDIDLVMLAGRYTLLEQPALAELLPLCAERGVWVVAAAVFNTGLLSRPEVSDGARYNFTQAPATLINRARRMAEACSRHGIPLPQAAIQFPFGHPAVCTVVVGARTAEQMAQCAAWLDKPVPARLWDALRAQGFLSAEVPVPR
jgi:D-threo-aldose 1-dehydrogenase